MNHLDKSNSTIDPKVMAADIVKRSGTSFYWAMRILPKPKRAAMFAIYAFCREVDDIADGSDRPEVKMGFLEKWRTEIKRLYDGHPEHIISLALADPIKIYNLDREDFLAIIDGMEMDAVKELRIVNMAELELYCDRVACAVGRLSNQVFGLTGELNRDLAKALGDALQLTNILRDVHEDAERNHIYLPSELRAKYGINGNEVSEIIDNPALSKVCGEIAEIAADRYRQADEIIEKCGKHLIRPATIMKSIYFQLFCLLQQRGWDRLELPVTMSKFQKMRLAFRAWLF